jgi:trimethylamine:corrinoid methyltransferase-like protein
VRVADGRVHFNQRYLLDFLESQHRPLPEPDSTRIQVVPGGGALNILDHRTSELREPTTDDLLLTFRVCDRLGLGGDPPLIPADIPMPLREVALYRLAWENTRAFAGRDIGSVEVGEYVFEMAQAAGKQFHIPLYMISPLRMNAENLTLVLHFADRLPSLSVSTMPMPGATAPLLAPGYLVQSLAEMIGGYAILSLLVPYREVAFGATLVAFNPYENVIACGSPEALLQGQLQLALLARYGVRPLQFFWSMAGGCDAQAAAERMAGVILGALSGVRTFGVAGRLQGEAFSLEQLLIDVEIAAYVERVLAGQAWIEPDSDWIVEVKDAIVQGAFLGSPSTVSNYKAELSRGHLFTRYSLAQRKELAEPNLRKRVRDYIDLLNVPPPEYLPSEVRAELDRIYRRAEANLG